MGLLKNLHIVKRDNRTVNVFENLLGATTFQTLNYIAPKDYIRQYWQAISGGAYDSIRGNLFELIIYTLLYRERVTPFYTQAQVAFVPNVNFDALLYNQSTPISLSLKTSLRERYKQADLEAIALKYVHRKSKCYLLTMDSNEARVRKRKILDGEIIGLDEIIDCNTDDINNLITDLKGMQFIQSQQIEVVTGHLVN